MCDGGGNAGNIGGEGTHGGVRIDSAAGGIRRVVVIPIDRKRESECFLLLEGDW
jgi:hypothetical protein